MTIIEKLKALWAFADSAKAFPDRFDNVQEQVDHISENLADVSKLMDLVSTKELAASEFALFKTEAALEQFATVDDVQAEIDSLTALKTSYDTSPAIGSRMIRTKNSQITEVNRRLQQMHAIRARLTNNGQN